MIYAYHTHIWGMLKNVEGDHYARTRARENRPKKTQKQKKCTKKCTMKMKTPHKSLIYKAYLDFIVVSTGLFCIYNYYFLLSAIISKASKDRGFIN